MWSNPWCPNGAATSAWGRRSADTRPVDQWVHMRWDAPAHLLLDVGLTPVGRIRADGLWMYGTDILTPKDEFSTHYFWAFSRNDRIDDPSVDEFWRQSIELSLPVLVYFHGGG